MLLKLRFSAFPRQSSLRCFYAQKQSGVLNEENFNWYLLGLVQWTSKLLFKHLDLGVAVQESAFPSLLLHVDLGKKDKKWIEGQHQENKNGNENDSWGKYSDTKNSVKCSYLLVARYRQSLVDLVLLIKQGMSKSTD